MPLFHHTQVGFAECLAIANHRFTSGIKSTFAPAVAPTPVPSRFLVAGSTLLTSRDCVEGAISSLSQIVPTLWATQLSVRQKSPILASPGCKRRVLRYPFIICDSGIALTQG